MVLFTAINSFVSLFVHTLLGWFCGVHRKLTNNWSVRLKTMTSYQSQACNLVPRAFSVAKQESLLITKNWLKLCTLNPVGHQSTNWILLLVLILAIAALTSFGTTSPRNSRQQAMYFPWRGSHFTIWLAGSKQAAVISATLNCSW